MPSLTSTKSALVPDCEGKKVSSCEKMLLDAGFEVATKIENIESSIIKKNLVVKTDPEAGRSIKQGTTITIYKSIGEEVVVIEDYTGRNATDVKKILEEKQIEVTVRKKDPEDKDKKYEEDEIIDQSIAKGSELKKGESIILYVANNEEKFPDFIGEGYSLDDIKAFCTEFELNCSFVEEETDTYPEGKIFYQSRKADTVVARGSNLTVKIAIKPKPKPEEEEDGE
ncbi:MAG: PASTA domain-containing protein [Bacilli bacterium]|nr:PASTA domain-containing protein [Bacilli bacterium]